MGREGRCSSRPILPGRTRALPPPGVSPARASSISDWAALSSLLKSYERGPPGSDQSATGSTEQKDAQSRAFISEGIGLPQPEHPVEEGSMVGSNYDDLNVSLLLRHRHSTAILKHLGDSPLAACQGVFYRPVPRARFRPAERYRGAALVPASARRDPGARLALRF